MDRTFVAIKPDAVERNLIGEIISRFEKKGFKIIGLKMIQMDKNLAEQHYIEHKGKPFFDDVVKFISSGPIIAMVVEGINTVSAVRKFVGATKPEEADSGTIRSDYAIVKESNIIHASDSEASAKREIALYFNKNELCTDWHTLSEKWL